MAKNGKKGSTKVKREPRQKRLPGTEDPAIQELESAAEEYGDIRDRRMALNQEESKLKQELLASMRKHDRNKYRHNGVEIEVEPGEESVKVRIRKPKEDKAEAAEA